MGSTEAFVGAHAAHGRARKNATKSAASESYSLIFDSKDKVIGIYFYSENQQGYPWQQMQSTGPFPYPHWGLHIFFQDSTNACL